MGDLTLANLKAEIRSNLGGRTDADSRLTRILNLAQKRMVRGTGKFEELETTEDLLLTYTGVPATDRVLAFSALSNSNPHKIFSVGVLNGTDSVKLHYVPHNKIDLVVPNPAAESTNKPSHYTIWQRKFEWFRVPDKAYTIRVRSSRWPTDFSDADETVKSDLSEKDDLLLALGTQMLFESLGNDKKSATWFRTYSTLYDEAVIEDKRKPDAIITAMPSQEVGGTGDYWADPFVRSVQDVV